MSLRLNRPADYGPSTLLRSALVLFLATFLLSVVPEIGWHLPAAMGGLIQFAYRLVTYENLAIFVALLAALAIRDAPLPTPLRRADAVAWIATLALSGVGLTVKLAHAARTLGPADAEAAWATDPGQLARMPPTYYGERDYAVVDESRMLYNVPPEQRHDAIAVALPPGNGFGETGTMSVGTPVDRWVVTDVVAFPWNRLVLDGQMVPTGQTRNAPNHLAVRVPAGRHTLGFAFEPPVTWSILRVGSFALSIVWVLIVTILFVRMTRRSVIVSRTL